MISYRKGLRTTDMRKCFPELPAASALLAMAMAANAADVGAGSPTYVPPPFYGPPPFSWSGFYLGGNFGAAWGQNTVSDSFLGLSFGSLGNNGSFIGGGQVGLNYQLGNFVFGAEADMDGVAKTNNTTSGVLAPGIGTIQVSSNSRWIATVAGRLG